ncbi:MAG: oligosaccharide flippase family protein [Clostridiales bacterium]|nr:MAG: oligosaccharide flippase family protein [Clostridiales bacterium]
MKRRTMTGNAALLSVFSIIAKVISALYRVPLTSVLGAEGMGMYQLVFSIYALILALTTGGIPVAVSRLTSENNALKKDSRIVLKNALLSVVGTSVVLAAFLCVLSGFVARIQGNEGVKSGYYVIAPAVVFVGALSMFRGWFQGNNDVIPTAVSGLFEQVFKLAFGLTLAKILSKYSVIYGVIGALSGVMISEFVALIYIVITYFFRAGRFTKSTRRKVAIKTCETPF